MTSLLPIPTALCLPAPDIAALIQGRIIAAIPRMFIRPGQKFALYPVDSSAIPLSINKYYCSNFVSVAQSISQNSESKKVFTQPQQLKLIPEDEQLQLSLSTEEKVLIHAYAQCELSQIIDDKQSLEKLSRLTIWTQEALEKILHQQQYIFLSYLRVYKLSQPYEISLKVESKKLGKFVGLPNSLRVSNTNPVLPDRTFTTRKQQLEKLEPPQHPELEKLLDVLSLLTVNNSVAKQLQEHIHLFLGWSNQKRAKNIDSNLAWINQISELGDRTQEEEKKSHYQAGTDFENITRKALEFLGFKVDESYKGGAGGLDLYCSEPYPVVIECKSGKSIPNRTVEELLKLGGTHLGADKVLDSPKLIIAPNYAKPTQHTLKAAKEWKVSIIKAMSLQKLSELEAQYPGSINLIELKKYLESGVIDNQIQEYINEVKKYIELRSHLVQLVKDYLQNSKMDSTGVDALHGAYFGSQPPKPLQTKEMHEILIELSSPLTGYLGRIKGTDRKSDKFYFLRDLPT
ncbi:MAG: DUF1802 family protein [Rivularia sp. (in: cyanobacteria)]